MRPGGRIAWLVCATLAAGVTTGSALTPAQSCEAGKNKAAGKYASCRHTAETRFALTPDLAKLTADLARCGAKQAQIWSRLEARAATQGGACPSAGDQEAVQELIGSDTTTVATSLAGGPLLGGFLGVMLRTGQASCFADAETPIPCPGIGQDGELKKGLGRAYVDNGDGTITDTKTQLTWEKLSDDDSIHDVDTTTGWTGAFAKVAALNAAGFAGHTDWRVPNVIEMQSLMEYGVTVPLEVPAISPVFNTGCVAGCSVLTCSCTRPFFTWTSTTTADDRRYAWGGWFQDGVLIRQFKTNPLSTRAVRGGV
jgi:hypothetical protein